MLFPKFGVSNQFVYDIMNGPNVGTGLWAEQDNASAVLAFIPEKNACHMFWALESNNFVPDAKAPFSAAFIGSRLA